MAAVQRLVRCFFIQWRVICFMLDTNPLSLFGVERDMVMNIISNPSVALLRVIKQTVINFLRL